MKEWLHRSILFVCIGLLFLSTAAFADEDPADYLINIKPGFVLSGESYGQFETPVYTIENPLDNLLIAVDADRSPEAVVRMYARFQNEKTGTWSRYSEFDGEYQFAAVEPIKAWQLLFIIRDASKGKTAITRFTAQGRKLGEELMEFLAQKPVTFKAAREWPKPAFVNRKGWNARPPKGTYNLQKPAKIILHHTWRPTQAQYSGAGTIRGIQDYHMDDPKTGWADIGYHYLIGHDGVIYEGRPDTAVGAHCPPNTSMIGVCVIGDYDPGQDQNNAKIEKSLVDLLSHLSSKYGIDPKTAYFGHRNFSTKSCPGDGVYDRLPEYRDLVLKNIGEVK